MEAILNDSSTTVPFSAFDEGKARQMAIKKTLQNPLLRGEGGYGIELGNKGGVNITCCLEIKLRGEGLRVIYYKLIRTETEMLVVIIGAREDENDAREKIARYRL